MIYQATNKKAQNIQLRNNNIYKILNKKTIKTTSNIMIRPNLKYQIMRMNCIVKVNNNKQYNNKEKSQIV